MKTLHKKILSLMKICHHGKKLLMRSKEKGKRSGDWRKDD